jgi:hypothetical protein
MKETNKAFLTGTPQFGKQRWEDNDEMYVRDMMGVMWAAVS